jgi:putative endonuclease
MDGSVCLHAALCRRLLLRRFTTGSDLSTRVAEHNAGKHEGYTYFRRPIVLVWSEYFDRIMDAIAAERKIKGWSRAKKEALIKDDWQRISALAKRRTGKPRDQ